MFSKYYLFLKEKNCICCQFRQHNPTHYAQDKTTQQIMHNTTHCAPADSILYTVNICFSDAHCQLILPHHKNKTFHFNTRVPNFHPGKEIMILLSIIHLSFIWKTCYTHYPPHCNLFYSRYSKHSNIIICACTVNVLCQTFFEYLEEVWIPDLQPESQSKERNRLLQDLKC